MAPGRMLVITDKYVGDSERIQHPVVDLIISYIYHGGSASKIYEFLDGRPHNEVLISSEDILFSSIKKGYKLSPSVIVERLLDLFEGWDVSLILFTRNRETIIPSIYAQSYAHFFRNQSEVCTLERFVRSVATRGSFYHAFFDYDLLTQDLVKLYKECNIYVGEYEELGSQASLKSLANFIGVDGLPESLPKSNARFTKAGHQSQSLNIYSYLKRLVKSDTLKFVSPQLKRKLRQVLSFVVFPAKEFMLTDAEKHMIAKAYERLS